MNHPLHTFAGVIAYPTTYGALLWVPEDPPAHAAEQAAAGNPVPPEVVAVQQHARTLGCDYALFDRDADVVAELPVWDW